MSRPLAKRLHFCALRYWHVPCCPECNQKRGTISNLFMQLHGLRRDIEAGVSWRDARMERWLKLRTKALPSMLEFRRYYYERLTGEFLEACLYELQEVGCPEE